MRIAPGNPGSGFSTPQVIDLRNGVCLVKSKGWTVITRKAWNQLKNYRLRSSSPVVTEHKDLPNAKTLVQLKEEFPIVEEKVVPPELPAPAPAPALAESEREDLHNIDSDPDAPEINDVTVQPARKGGLRRRKTG
jgi:hypothetical protein